ncbi:MAG: hypothetical protein P8J63_05455, partial [Verrucomicrobiota bacterium]|nr:hypothetical protein [Verrucomicrobiota bacterium]
QSKATAAADDGLVAHPYVQVRRQPACCTDSVRRNDGTNDSYHTQVCSSHRAPPATTMKNT